MSDTEHDESKPIEAQVPPDVVAAPHEVVAAPGDDVRWWRPSWRDAAQHVGYRWVFLAPAVVLVALLIGACFLAGIRSVLLFIGAKLLVFAGAVAISLAGWVFRRAAGARREPFCIHCGYDLTGLPDNYRCPECGRPYNWRLIAEYRRDPQWFIERWKRRGDLPQPDAAFDAGPIRSRRRKDGTA